MLGPLLITCKEKMTLDPTAGVLILTSFVIARSVIAVIVVVTVEVLFEGTGSVVVLPTVAELARVPVALLLTFPRISNDTLLPETTLPMVSDVIHGFHETPASPEYSTLVMVEGTLSVTETFTASLGPALEMARVNCTLCPAITGDVLQVFTIARSAVAFTVFETVEVLLARTGSNVELLTMAVLSRIVPEATLLFTVATMVSVAVPPLIRVPSDQFGAVQDPTDGVALTKVSPE